MWLSICGKLHLSFIVRLEYRQKLEIANFYSLSLKGNQVQLPQLCAGVGLYPNSPPKNVNPWIPVLDIYLTMPNTSNMTITLKLDSPSPRGWLRVLVATLIKDRMDITGARWTMWGAEAVLPLSSLYINGNWDKYWQFHQQQEHKVIFEKEFTSESRWIKISHLGNSGFRCNLDSTCFIAFFVREIPFWETVLLKLKIGYNPF